jgi:hypothetical protein
LELDGMKAVAWIAEGTWPACVDAARTFVPEGADLVLLHVTDEDIPSVAHGAYAGLFGRSEPARDPGPQLDHLAAESATSILEAAAARFGRPCHTEERVGRMEHEVLAAAAGAGLLILARDGDRIEQGPKSLSHAARFVVEHAPCAVLLVWPEHPA